MTDKTAGSDIDAYCSKCKLVLNHHIIAMNGTKVVRVVCTTCKAEHAYKASATKRSPATRKKATTTKSARAKRVDSPTPSHYDEIMAGRDIASAKRYKITEIFEA
ncbi:hypothetical protein KAI87_06620, partial [Myxococcota bacterium]|nr:hypothetical protein [Myxococcota bacterium]